MLDRVIDAPAHQGRTDLEQNISPGWLGGKMPSFLGLCDQPSSAFGQMLAMD